MLKVTIPQSIYLYDEGVEGIDFKEIKDFIREKFGRIKIQIVKLEREAVKTKGLLFDFINTSRSLATTEYAKIKNTCHIILTSKLFATFDEFKRLHIRAAIFGYPSVISTSGIVEGPAKPKDYYIYKQKYARLGVWDMEADKVKARFKGRFIDYQDKRMTEVLKGYIAQAIFFYITGEPFCENKDCRLFNAHWQEDLIHAQIKKRKFCRRHRHKMFLNKNIAHEIRR